MKSLILIITLFCISYAQEETYPTINGCKLEPYANCSKVDLSNQNLRDLDLQNSNFEGANFEGAILDGTDLTKANLKNVNCLSAPPPRQVPF